MTGGVDRLIEAVRVMDRLRSPGGCPWDAAQTHQSLAPYLLEETYETLEAIELADPVLLREELGDLLLQVLFHARMAEETEGFSIDEVAGDLVDKLVRRHPHVFAASSGTADGAATAATADTVAASWEEIKKAEKRRNSATDGIAMGQPALSLAAKLIHRSVKAGVEVQAPPAEDIGGKLFAIVAEAVQAGLDPELALRATAREFSRAIREQENSEPAG